MEEARARGSLVMTEDRFSRDQPWALWREAAKLPVIDHAITALYDDMAQVIRDKAPVCWASGRCCNFNAYGHLLYVTGLEIAWFLSKLNEGKSDDAWTSRLDLKSPCPFQVNNLCTTHAIRPLGCRIYFCQRGTEEWQHEVYEIFQSRLRQLHDEHALPYRYMEWRGGLMEATAES